jgi:glycosyltransferase involved in cell wall biosynthesis
VFPSRYEPFGTVTLEAWGHRRPLIAAASAGPAEIVRDGADALLVPIDDAPALAAAITRVIDEPGLGPRLVEAGWQRYQADFTEAACVKRYINMFQSLLAAHCSGHAAAS